MALIELLKPVSWNPNVSELPSGSWAGLISNVDEPFTSPDGSTISCSTASVACEIDFSDVVFIRNGIDEILTVVPQIRMRSDTPLTVYMYLRKYGNVLSYQDLFVLGDNVFRNWSIYKTSWHGAFAGTDANALDSIQMNLIVFNAEPWNLQVDTIGIQVQYQNPPGIETKPGEGLLGIDTGPPTRLVRNYARPSLGTIQFVPKDVEFFRQEIVRLDNYYLILSQHTPVLDSTYYPGKSSLTLAGSTPLPSFDFLPGKASVALAGKVPDSIDVTADIVISIPDRGKLYTQGQEVGDEDSVLPSRTHLRLEGQQPDVERSWTVIPETGPLALSGQALLLSGTVLIAKGTADLTGKNTERINSGESPDSETLDLTGKVPQVGQGVLTPAGRLSIREHSSLPVPRGALALAGSAPIVRSIIIQVGGLALSGKKPVLDFATVLPPGDHGIISVSTRRGIEHIGTPSDEIEL
jgi:hypothetical protein